jgi:hypothetical protein
MTVPLRVAMLGGSLGLELLVELLVHRHGGCGSYVGRGIRSAVIPGSAKKGFEGLRSLVSGLRNSASAVTPETRDQGPETFLTANVRPTVLVHH